MVSGRMIRPALVIAVLLPAGPALAQAQAQAPGVPEAAFTGTIVSTYPDGRQARLWLERGGTFRGQGRTGKFNSGRWTLKGERICLRQSRPVPVPFTYCAPLQQGDVGARWTGKAVTGEPIRIELVAGR